MTCSWKCSALARSKPPWSQYSCSCSITDSTLSDEKNHNVLCGVGSQAVHRWHIRNHIRCSRHNHHRLDSQNKGHNWGSPLHSWNNCFARKVDVQTSRNLNWYSWLSHSNPYYKLEFRKFRSSLEYRNCRTLLNNLKNLRRMRLRNNHLTERTRSHNCLMRRNSSIPMVHSRKNQQKSGHQQPVWRQPC